MRDDNVCGGMPVLVLSASVGDMDGPGPVRTKASVGSGNITASSTFIIAGSTTETAEIHGGLLSASDSNSKATELRLGNIPSFGSKSSSR